MRIKGLSTLTRTGRSIGSVFIIKGSRKPVNRSPREPKIDENPLEDCAEARGYGRRKLMELGVCNEEEYPVSTLKIAVVKEAGANHGAIDKSARNLLFGRIKFHERV